MTAGDLSEAMRQAQNTALDDMRVEITVVGQPDKKFVINEYYHARQSGRFVIELLEVKGENE